MPEPMRQQLVAEQAGRIADLLGVNIETINFDSNGIKLPHDQMEQLISAAIGKGYFTAIKVLSDAAEAANAKGPDHSLTAWAVYLSAASFLEGKLES